MVNRFFAVIVLVPLAVIVIALILSGIIFNTSATQPHSKAVAWGAHFTMINSVARRSRGDVPTVPLARDVLQQMQQTTQTD